MEGSEMCLTRWIEEFASDVKYALRQLRGSPAFTTVAALTLALGVGANSAIFALADATLIRPLPFATPERLLMLWERAPTTSRGVVAPFEFVEWNGRNRSFEAIAAIGVGERAAVGADGMAVQIPAQTVTVRFFDVLGVKPIAGRTFLAVDDRPNPDVVVLSEGFWRNRFAGDPAVIGRAITLDGRPFTVIGIVPAEFQVYTRSSVWTVLDTPAMRGPRNVGHYLRVIGRLGPGVTPDAARADMTALAEAIAQERPELNRGRGVTIEPLHDGLIGRELRLTSMLLMGVVGFVLLMCCANEANLLLARTTGRARELAVRSAIGAGRQRIVRQLLTESLVLSALGGVIGAGIGAAILEAAPSLIPPGLLPVSVTLAFDGRVLMFCAVTALVVAVCFGAVPAWQATGKTLVHVMASGGRTVTGGGARIRALLTVGEVATAMLLLCGAGLLVRTLVALEEVDPGHRTRDVLTMVVNVPFSNPVAPNPLPYATPASRLQFYDAVEREIGSIPGVRRVAWGSALPLDGWWVGMAFQVEGDPRPEAMRDSARYQLVSPPYFSTLGIPILRGRGFTDLDRAGGAPVCIVNEAFVRRYLGDRPPLGTRLVVRGMTTGGAALPIREIVGVVRQVRERPDETEAEPHIYVPLAQDPAWRLSLVVQPADGPAAALASAVRAGVARVDRDRPVAQVRTLVDIGEEATSMPRFRAVMVAAFAILALALAMVGVFGVLAYSVQQRTREFGVRIALGASVSDVLRLVLAGAARTTVAGLAIGLVGAGLLSRSIGTLLFGVPPLDPVAFVGAAAVLLVTAVVATTIPALRAARVNPIVALRNE
jgi:putative ABC transport system permease protein